VYTCIKVGEQCWVGVLSCGQLNETDIANLAREPPLAAKRRRGPPPKPKKPEELIEDAAIAAIVEAEVAAEQYHGWSLGSLHIQIVITGDTGEVYSLDTM
jgi:hypothetical protein